MEFVHEFELFQNDKVIIQSYKSLKNEDIPQLLKKLDEKGFRAVFLNPKLIISIRYILIAANRALDKRDSMKGKAKDIVKIFLDALMPPGNHKESELGLEIKFESGPGILVVFAQKNQELDLLDYIKSEKDSLDNIGVIADFERIKSLFGITEKEAKLDSDIRGSLYNHLALKNLR